MTTTFEKVPEKSL